MPAEAAVLVRTFKVGQYECTMSARKPVPGDAQWMTCEWSPHLPARGEFANKPKLMAQYRDGRDRFFAELGAMLGHGAVMVIE